jgi:hypothetical protein
LVEGDHHSRGFVLRGVGYRLPDDLLVAKVDAVEHTNGEANSTATGEEVACVPNDVHVSSVAASW